MKLRSLLIAIVLLWAIPSFATISCVHTPVAVSTDRNTATTVTLNASTANAIFVDAGWVDGGHGLPINDSAGNTYVIAANPVFDGNSETHMIYYANASTGAFTPTSLTVQASQTGTFPSLRAYACSGVVSGNPFDLFVTTNSNTMPVGSLQYSSSISPNFTNELIIAGLTGDGISSLTGSTTIDSGMTMDGAAPGAGNAVGLASASIIQTSVVSVQPTWTVSPNAYLNLSMISIRSADGVPDPTKCTGSSPNWTATAWAYVYLCHIAASNGDTITVAPGSYTATVPQSITKSVTLTGTGVTVTDSVCASACNVVTDNVLSMTESSAGNLRLKGFTFMQGTSLHQAPSATILWLPGGKPMVMQNVSFGTNILSGGWHGSLLMEVQTQHGVIANNYIYGHASSTPCQGLGGLINSAIQAPITPWGAPPTYGTADTNGDLNLYVEGNHFFNYGGGNADDNTRAVFRNNYLSNSDWANHGADSSTYGMRYSEIYNNTFVLDNTLLADCGGGPFNVTDWIFWRGGSARIWNNAIPVINQAPYYGPASGVSFIVENLRRDVGNYACWSVVTDPGAGHPAPHQVGWGYSVGATNPGGNTTPQDLEPVYLWANTGTGNYGQPNSDPSVEDYSPIDSACGGSPDSSTTYIVKNREWYTQNASIDTTQGVSSGVSASRPSTCTTGVAYWNTDLNRLDICTATNTWGNSYQPYQYPHPLVEQTAPAPSTFDGVRIRPAEKKDLK